MSSPTNDPIRDTHRWNSFTNFLLKAFSTEARPKLSHWIGVDLDGTLARLSPGSSPMEIGDPVPPMMERVQRWIAEGRTVKIFTARAAVPELVPPIRTWLAHHGLPDLEITNVKDFGMIQLWDDRCVQVITNTGHPAAEMDVRDPLAPDSHFTGPNANPTLFTVFPENPPIVPLARL